MLRSVQNVTEYVEDLLYTPAWIIYTYLAVIVGGGFLANAILAGYLSRNRKLPAVLHLALTDVATLMFLAPYEVIYLSEATGNWIFPNSYCPIFLGLEVLLGTATIYLLIIMNFSTKKASQSDTEERTTSLKVPLLIIWLLALSLSIPEFYLAEVISPRPEYHICNLPKRAAFFVSAFRLGLPIFLLACGLLLTFYRCCENAGQHEISLTVCLTVTYLIFSLQRSVFAVFYGKLFPLSGPDAFRTPPLADVIDSPSLTLILALIHYFSSAMRPIIYWLVMKSNKTRTTSDNNNTNNDENHVI